MSNLEGRSAISGDLYRLSLEDDSIFRDIKKHAWDEALCRLKNKKTREAIPDSMIFRILIDTMKVEAEMQKRAADSTKPALSSPQANLIQIVAGLPVERAAGLLVQSIRQVELLGGVPSDQIAALVHLVGEDQAGKLLAVEAKEIEA